MYAIIARNRAPTARPASITGAHVDDFKRQGRYLAGPVFIHPLRGIVAFYRSERVEQKYGML